MTSVKLMLAQVEIAIPEGANASGAVLCDCALPGDLA